MEPGKDGVGDYTRKLATALLLEGHSVSVMALNDPYIINIVHKDFPTDNETLISYRIPATWSSSKRFNHAKTFLDQFKPDWISLQFVIYSFHPKGLPFNLGSQLADLIKGSHLHIMFHEIWIGFTEISPLRHKIVGFLQRLIIKSLILRLGATLITTTNGLYQSILKRNNIEAKILPLFSNIPVTDLDKCFISDVYSKLSIHKKFRSSWKIIGVFGSVFPQAKLELTLKQQLEIASEENKSIAFISFGKADDLGLRELERIKNIFYSSIQFCHLGELPALKVSSLFQILDLGVACTPKQHLGKSGVFAAMRLHGLEVLISNEDKIPEYQDEIDSYHQKIISKPSKDWDVRTISKQFLQFLN